jgi:hypothetical protein
LPAIAAAAIAAAAIASLLPTKGEDLELGDQLAAIAAVRRARRPDQGEDLVTRARGTSAYGLVESRGSWEREVDHNVVLLILARLCDRSPRRYVAGDRVRFPDVDPLRVHPGNATLNLQVTRQYFARSPTRNCELAGFA